MFSKFSLNATKPGHVFRFLVLMVTAMFVFEKFVPGAAQVVTLKFDNLDDSWTQVLHLAFVRHFQFGTDIVFTYGPWGLLGRGYNPQTYALCVVCWTGLSLIYLGAGWRLAGRISSNRLAMAAWLAGFTLASSLPAVEDINNRLTAWCILALFTYFFVDEGKPGLLQMLLVATMAWLGLVKFTGLIEGLGVVLVMAVDTVCRQKRFPWVLLAWVAGVFLFWFGAHQQMASFIPFLRNSWLVAGGYTDAMMTSADSQQMTRALVYALMTLLWCGVVWRIAWPRYRFYAILPAAALALILFMSFKVGYVRNDWDHEPSAVMSLILAGLACLVVAGEKKIFRNAAGALVLTALFGFFVVHLWMARFSGRFIGKFDGGTLFPPVAIFHSGYLQEHYQEQLDKFRTGLPGLPMETTADLYPYDQFKLLAHPVDYRPRPVIQSYSVYTPELAKMNAAYLRSPGAASNIVFAIQPIDVQYPSMPDGLSWPELLTRYDIKGKADVAGTSLLLTRAAVPREYHLTPLPMAPARLGQAIAVPSSTNGPIWVEIKITKTLLGKLADTLYKPDRLLLVLTLHDHSQHFFRYVPGMGEGGFLLSPTVTDVRDFTALASGGYRQADDSKVVDQVGIAAATDDGQSIYFQSAIDVRFYRLEFPEQHPSLVWP